MLRLSPLPTPSQMGGKGELLSNILVWHVTEPNLNSRFCFGFWHIKLKHYVSGNCNQHSLAQIQPLQLTTMPHDTHAMR